MHEGFDGTDTSSCIQQFTDIEVRTFGGRASNLKVTYARDVLVAERLLLSGSRPARRDNRLDQLRICWQVNDKRVGMAVHHADRAGANRLLNLVEIVCRARRHQLRQSIDRKTPRILHRPQRRAIDRIDEPAIGINGFDTVRDGQDRDHDVATTAQALDHPVPTSAGARGRAISWTRTKRDGNDSPPRCLPGLDTVAPVAEPSTGHRHRR